MPLSSSSVPRSALLLGLPLAWLWFRLLDHLRIEWTVNEQYAYGWAVPFLCAYLLWRRVRTAHRPLSIGAPASGPASVGPDSVEPSNPPPFSSPLRLDRGEGQGEVSLPHPDPKVSFSVSAFQFFCVFLLLAFLLTRWVEVANPDWRLVSWALALEVIVFTLLALPLVPGRMATRHLAFPILFLLVAVPWPTGIEQPLIQTLTRGVVAVTVELLNAFGIAAVPRGNVIETAGGLVDIDEACSGIRSLQAVLMLALFFGELRRFTVKRRVALCLAAFALAALFNLVRTFALSLVASQRGPAAVASWHDPAGIAILVSCFIGVWAVAAWLGRSPVGRDSVEPSPRPPSPDAPATVPRRPAHRLSAFGFPVVLVTLLLAGELAVHFWYAGAPRHQTSDWTAQFPTNNATFQAADIPAAAEKILRFTEGRSGAWQNPDGTRWQMIYLRWNPGRTAVTLARNHTPEICLPAAGRALRGVADMPPVAVGDVRLPFRSFATGSEGRPLFVFYTLWEDGAVEQRSATQLLTREVRLQAVLDRRRNPGQRVLELAVWGARDEAHAAELLRAELPRLIQPDAATQKR